LVHEADSGAAARETAVRVLILAEARVGGCNPDVRGEAELVAMFQVSPWVTTMRGLVSLMLDFAKGSMKSLSANSGRPVAKKAS